MRKLVVLLMLVVLLTGCNKDSVVDTKDYLEEHVLVEDTELFKVEVRTKEVALCLDNSTFYNIKLPVDVEYITDYSKYIYGENPQFTIQVISDVTESDFSKSVAIHNSEPITKNVLASKDIDKTPREAAILLGDKAVVLRSYEEEKSVFLAVLESFLDENNKPYSDVEIKFKEGYTELIELSYNGSIKPTLINKATVGNTQLQKYDDGCICVTMILDKYDNVKSNYLKKLNVMSECEVEQVYSSNSTYYASAGDFHLGIYNKNYNSQVVIIGKGEECKCNLISVLNQCLQEQVVE